jgi:hypothetical protein
VEDRLGLTTITALLAVISTLTLGEQGGLASLVLGDLVLGVLAALLALAVGVTGLGNVDLLQPVLAMCVASRFCCHRVAEPAGAPMTVSGRGAEEGGSL